MKYGMNLLLWSGEVTDDVLQVCGKLKEIGYDGVELPIFNLDLDYSAIGSELELIFATVTASVHTPTMPHHKIFNIPFAEFYDTVRRKKYSFIRLK